MKTSTKPLTPQLGRTDKFLSPKQITSPSSLSTSIRRRLAFRRSKAKNVSSKQGSREKAPRPLSILEIPSSQHNFIAPAAGLGDLKPSWQSQNVNGIHVKVDETNPTDPIIPNSLEEQIANLQLAVFYENELKKVRDLEEIFGPLCPPDIVETNNPNVTSSHFDESSRISNKRERNIASSLKRKFSAFSLSGLFRSKASDVPKTSALDDHLKRAGPRRPDLREDIYADRHNPILSALEEQYKEAMQRKEVLLKAATRGKTRPPDSLHPAYRRRKENSDAHRNTALLPGRTISTPTQSILHRPQYSGVGRRSSRNWNSPQHKSTKRDSKVYLDRLGQYVNDHAPLVGNAQPKPLKTESKEHLLVLNPLSKRPDANSHDTSVLDEYQDNTSNPVHQCFEPRVSINCICGLDRNQAHSKTDAEVISDATRKVLDKKCLRPNDIIHIESQDTIITAVSSDARSKLGTIAPHSDKSNQFDQQEVQPVLMYGSPVHVPTLRRLEGHGFRVEPETLANDQDSFHARNYELFRAKLMPNTGENDCVTVAIESNCRDLNETAMDEMVLNPEGDDFKAPLGLPITSQQGIGLWAGRRHRRNRCETSTRIGDWQPKERDINETDESAALTDDLIRKLRTACLFGGEVQESTVENQCDPPQISELCPTFFRSPSQYSPSYLAPQLISKYKKAQRTMPLLNLSLMGPQYEPLDYLFNRPYRGRTQRVSAELRHEPLDYLFNRPNDGRTHFVPSTFPFDAPLTLLPDGFGPTVMTEEPLAYISESFSGHSFEPAMTAERYQSYVIDSFPDAETRNLPVTAEHHRDTLESFLGNGFRPVVTTDQYQSAFQTRFLPSGFGPAVSTFEEDILLHPHLVPEPLRVPDRLPKYSLAKPQTAKLWADLGYDAANKRNLGRISPRT